MILGFQGLAQNPLNQRPTVALFSISRDMSSTLLCCECLSASASLPRGRSSIYPYLAFLIPEIDRLTQGSTAVEPLIVPQVEFRTGAFGSNPAASSPSRQLRRETRSSGPSGRTAGAG